MSQNSYLEIIIGILSLIGIDKLFVLDPEEVKYWTPEGIILEKGFNRMNVASGGVLSEECPAPGCATRKVTVISEKDTAAGTHSFVQIRVGNMEGGDFVNNNIWQ